MEREYGSLSAFEEGLRQGLGGCGCYACRDACGGEHFLGNVTDNDSEYESSTDKDGYDLEVGLNGLGLDSESESEDTGDTDDTDDEDEEDEDSEDSEEYPN